MPEPDAAYAIRGFRDGDADRLVEIFSAAVRLTGPQAYSPRQAAAWNARRPDAEDHRRRVAAGHLIFCAVDTGDRPAAFVVLEPDGHLDLLYTDPAHARRGLAGRLLEQAEAHAASTGLDRLHAEASDLARTAFERAGYVMVRRRVHNWAMEKRLR